MAIPRRRHQHHNRARFLIPAISATSGILLLLFLFLSIFAPSPNDDHHHLRHLNPRRHDSSGGKGGGNDIRHSPIRVPINAGVHNRDLWSSRNSKFFYGCSNASSKFAKAQTITHPNRYLLIVTSGGLNQQRTGVGNYSLQELFVDRPDDFEVRDAYNLSHRLLHVEPDSDNSLYNDTHLCFFYYTA